VSSSKVRELRGFLSDLFLEYGGPIVFDLRSGVSFLTLSILACFLWQTVH
jgi:hypothetical protein